MEKNEIKLVCNMRHHVERLTNTQYAMQFPLPVLKVSHHLTVYIGSLRIAFTFVSILKLTENVCM